MPQTNHVDPIRTRVTRSPRRQNVETTHPLPLLIRQLLNQRVQASRSSLNGSFTTKLDLESRPRTVTKLDDGIHLQTIFVTIMKNRAVQKLAVDPQIPNAQGLEKESKSLQIIQETRWRTTKQMGCKRWVYEVSSPGAQIPSYIVRRSCRLSRLRVLSFRVCVLSGGNWSGDRCLVE